MKISSVFYAYLNPHKYFDNDIVQSNAIYRVRDRYMETDIEEDIDIRKKKHE